MKISIFQKEMLFSLKPNTSFLLPNTSFKATLFPTRLDLEDLEGDNRVSISWITDGPVKKYKAELNLEKERIEISGNSLKGYFRFILKAQENKIILICQRGPDRGFTYFFNKKEKTLLPKESLILVDSVKTRVSTFEKLSFGMHKALDVHKIDDRKDLKEIFPIWYSLYQKILSEKISHREGVAKLLNFPDEKKALEERFQDLFEAGFRTFVPELMDQYQGYLDPRETILKDASPLILLKEIGQKIRSLFFVQEESHFILLPKLLQPFMCGRLLHINCLGYGKMDFEWSKRRLAKIIYYPDNTKTIHIHPSKDIKSFRIRTYRNDKGRVIYPGDSIVISEKKPLYFDRFEK